MVFDIRQLRYAITAADHGSFYRAARTLDIEQSTLSRAVMKLECSIGMPIFERSRAGVTVTRAGAVFLRGARPMLMTADKLVAMCGEPRPCRRPDAGPQQLCLGR